MSTAKWQNIAGSKKFLNLNTKNFVPRSCQRGSKKAKLKKWKGLDAKLAINKVSEQKG